MKRIFSLKKINISQVNQLFTEIFWWFHELFITHRKNSFYHHYIYSLTCQRPIPRSKYETSNQHKRQHSSSPFEHGSGSKGSRPNDTQARKQKCSNWKFNKYSHKKHYFHSIHTKDLYFTIVIDIFVVIISTMRTVSQSN